ncbi:class I SAM-dependent methyltransferase [Conexibacter woesei]|uniref:Methyltransferase type 11 n=1 Tax=Conexibacter woesei (strain DSM 14684 / CCUG 47730 / CIP 108061 / JCM 11494 / NBRC 100937 / ID131577) TaxID=469383 RepID=D3F903_CONWI|nr:class I SAM-dependent methyltransferase [Conexibacter woesei]ADB52998.1 Methyltransferase type 11 [Conexibacter woesei DSM 14684]
MSIDRRIADYYELGAEHERLETISRVEGVRTRELLDRLLPAPPAVVLDVGGAAGIYALPLAAAGYEVHLLDPVLLHVQQAREASAAQAAAGGDPLMETVVGDARALPWSDGAADAVLLLGPLYHLDADGRASALAEARRVLRPGGLVLAAAISRFASTLDGIHARALADPAFAQVAAHDVRTGEHRNDPHERPEWFTTAYFHHPDELWEEVAVAGFAVEGVLAVEGVASFLRDEAWWLEDEQRRAALLDAIRSVEQEPSVLGASAHLLAVGRA